MLPDRHGRMEAAALGDLSLLACWRTHRPSPAGQVLRKRKLLVSFRWPPDKVGMPWRWFIKLKTERPRGDYHFQRHIPSAMEVAPRGKSVPSTVFPDLRLAKTVHPENRNLQWAPVCRSGHEGMVFEPEPAIGPGYPLLGERKAREGERLTRDRVVLPTQLARTPSQPNVSAARRRTPRFR